MPTKPLPKNDDAPIKVTRRNMILSCTQCSREVSVFAFEDKNHSEGWPLHRCGHDIRPFDKCEVL